LAKCSRAERAIKKLRVPIKTNDDNTVTAKPGECHQGCIFSLAHSGAGQTYDISCGKSKECSQTRSAGLAGVQD
jgi:hypothetical protein